MAVLHELAPAFFEPLGWVTLTCSLAVWLYPVQCSTRKVTHVFMVKEPVELYAAKRY